MLLLFCNFQEFFKDCLEHISTIPQCYQIHEMTSLTGGTFNPGIKLIFEKQLLIMVQYFFFTPLLISGKILVFK